MSDPLTIETPRGPVRLEVGREYIIQPPNPRKKRTGIGAASSGSLRSPTPQPRRIPWPRFNTWIRADRAESCWSNCGPPTRPRPPRWWRNDPRLAVEYRLRELARLAAEAELLRNMATAKPALEELLRRNSGEWGYEDPVYRFYHQSWKVYDLQEQTQEIVAQLQTLLPDRPLHKWFMQIIQAGTGKTFAPEHNQNWLPVTRPILEAYFHARYFLELAVLFAGGTDVPAGFLRSGYAALLYLYNLR